ncbi:MAG: substrate-binding domain-containing protein, partial [Spirochaetes bacterium]|nr:substrate-binding domain-containing protein [Spirochaetota bacterium]
LALGTHLAHHGCRRIGYLGCASIPVNRDRERGYRLAMMEAGSRAGSALIHTVEDIGGVNESAARFFIRKKCDAVMAFNDNFAIRLVQALARLDVLVPRDMAVTGFDNAPARAHFTPSITTISLSTYEMGYLAARWLRENILHRQARPLRLEVEGVLIEGASTRRRGTR